MKRAKRRIGRVLSVEREPSKLRPKDMNIVITFELRDEEEVRLYSSEIFPWTLLYLCKKAGLHLRKGVYNPQRLVGKDVWLTLEKDRVYTRVRIW